MNDGKVIFLVEDSAADVEAILYVFREIQFPYKIVVASDGADALDRLFKKRESMGLPALIILDLSLPKVSGLEILKRIRKDQSLKDVPVVMLSSSLQEEFEAEALDLGANLYIRKAIDPTRFLEKIRAFAKFLKILIQDF